MNEIKCPDCGYVFDSCDSESIVTFWGEDGPQTEECPNCDASLIITEHVERTWDVQRAAEAAGKE